VATDFAAATIGATLLLDWWLERRLALDKKHHADFGWHRHLRPAPGLMKSG
jgi:hypothetical protein